MSPGSTWLQKQGQGWLYFRNQGYVFRRFLPCAGELVSVLFLKPTFSCFLSSPNWYYDIEPTWAVGRSTEHLDNQQDRWSELTVPDTGDLGDKNPQSLSTEPNLVYLHVCGAYLQWWLEYPSPLTLKMPEFGSLSAKQTQLNGKKMSSSIKTNRVKYRWVTKY